MENYDHSKKTSWKTKIIKKKKSWITKIMPLVCSSVLSTNNRNNVTII
jgi:hypothetical protein